MYKYIDLVVERYPQLSGIKADIESAYKAMEEAYSHGHKLLIGGNGGSCADSEHIVGELMKAFIKKRALSDDFKKKLTEADTTRGSELAESLQGSLPAIAITGHTGLTTAFANDVDPNMTYAQQVYGYGCEGDVLLAISTSGNAENLMMAAVTAKAKGMKVVLLSGKDGGKLAKIADVSIIVPNNETYQIQELHLPIYHSLCLQLEEKFF